MGKQIVWILALLLTGLVGLAQDPESQDARERRKAASRLSGEGPSALPTLAKLTRDQDLEVRREAVSAVVDIGTIGSLDILLEALKDNDPEIQIAATDGIVNFYLPGYIRSGWRGSWRNIQRGIKGKFTDVNTAIIDPYVTVRPEVIERLGKLANGGASIESRANAARALGVLRGKAAAPEIVSAIRNVKEDAVIQEGLVALQKIRDQSVAKDVAYLVRDPQEKVQLLAIETMGLLRHTEALPDIERVFRATRYKKVRAKALEVMAMMPAPAHRDFFKMYLNDRDDRLRASAAEGLGRLGNQEDARLVEAIFEHEKDKLPKLSQAFSLVKLGRGEMSAVTPLGYLVDGLQSGSYRDVAVPLLSELARDEAVLAELNRYLPQGNKQERMGIARVLAISGNQESVKQLDILSRDSDAEVAAEALRAMRTLRARLG